VTSYRRNFICGGSFFFTANLAERRLRLLVDDIVSAKDDGFRCRSTILRAARACRASNRSARQSLSIRATLDLQMDQSAIPAASRLRREAADYAGACHPLAPKFAALIVHVLLELP
jgi:hypothetical protein